MSRDRRWLELRVRVQDPTARELVPDALVGLGARGVVEDDAGHVAYFPEPPEVDAFVSAAASRVQRATGASPAVEWRWQAHEDWAEAWKRGLGPRRVTPRLVVHPSWKKPRDLRPDDLVIVLDPGMAFGTAEHGTTRGCLRLLDGTVQAGDEVLDVGAGSGILSVAAVRLGAGSVTAVEGDPLACEAMEENLARNHVSSRVRIVQRWADADGLSEMGPFDGVVANIETGLLLPLLPGLAASAGTAGWILLSGILEDELPQVEEAAAQHAFKAAATDADGEWRSVLLRR